MNHTLSDTIQRKFVDTIDLSSEGWEILTPTGYVDVSTLYKTVQYSVWHLEFDDGSFLDCADNHILITENEEEIFAKNSLGVGILNEQDEVSIVTFVEKLPMKEHMYDLEIDSENHVYYTNGVLSHNTITTVSYLLWYSLFQADKMIAIVANKGDTAREILSRYTFALENVPFFLQPGCKTLNKGSIEFSNNTRIVARASSANSLRSLSCVTGDTEICVLNEKNGKISYVEIESLLGVNTENLKILTQEGFKHFDAVIDQGSSNDLLNVSFLDNSSITCTSDHQFLIEKDFLPACFLMPGDNLNGKIISSIEPLYKEQTVYDVYNVEDTNSYITNGVVSHNCNLVYLDEFAFVENAEKFYTSTYPVISSGKSTKIVITSTSNGVGNPFHRLWQAAMLGQNSFKPFRVDWNAVPGRDENWKKETIRNTSELQFAQEFLNCIHGESIITISTNTMIHEIEIEKLYNILLIEKEPSDIELQMASIKSVPITQS